MHSKKCLLNIDFAADVESYTFLVNPQQVHNSIQRIL